MQYSVNECCDATSYEKCCSKHNLVETPDITDANLIYQAFLDSKKPVPWKYDTQSYQTRYLSEIAKLQNEIINKTYEFLPSNEFTINERGKTRRITADKMHEKVMKHLVCDNVLTPALKKFLIYDNGSVIKGKGISFTRKRLQTHIRKFYNRNQSNDGYILLMDFSKYFDNIQHQRIYNLIAEYVKDTDALYLINRTLDRYKVDVSYMTDEEYGCCLENIFDYLAYQNIDRSLLTGDKFMQKRLNIGDQISQILGISYLIQFDNFVKIVNSVEFYGRYMDDCCIIHSDKKYLEQLLKRLVVKAEECGIHINLDKTKICKLSDRWKFCQLKYTVTDSGKIIKYMNHDKIHSVRIRLKKLSKILNAKEFRDQFYSWFTAYKKLMTNKQRLNILQLYKTLSKEIKYVHNQTC